MLSQKLINTNTISKLLVNDVFDSMKTLPNGLSEEEVIVRQGIYGKNEIQKAKTKPLWLRFLGNFVHLMALLLWVGGIIGFIAQLPEIGIAIWLVNIINGVFSFFQEYRAEKATEALQHLLPSYNRVIRDGLEKKVLSEDLVPGDIIVFEEGDRLSTDARLIEENELTIDQSTLSGESHPIRKTKEAVLRADLTLTEMPNLVFAGTTVASGSGKAVIYATGMDTEFGKIAHLTQTVGDELSPLQKELSQVTKYVSVFAVSIGVVFFVLAIFLAGVNLFEGFIFSLGMIVAFIPEGMLPTVTLSLAMGVQRMARKNALIKRLSAVETLGSTTVICTDKTGTLTQNEMTVTDVWMVDQRYRVEGIGYNPQGEFHLLNSSMPHSEGQTDLLKKDLDLLLGSAYYCNNSRLIPAEKPDGVWKILGDPTEAAVRVASIKGGLSSLDDEDAMIRIRELAFDSHRKRMSTINRNGKQLFSFTKGAPKEVLSVCTHYRRGGETLPLDPATAESIVKANDAFARKGLRVLAFAFRELTEQDSVRSMTRSYSIENVEKNMVFLGLMAMMDPPRPQVAQAIQECHSAGIRIIMITGDYGLTAESIAHNIGILNSPNPKVISGTDLDQMDDQQLKDILPEEVIFARVAPEHKLRVVTALKEMGEIVAVTGDGVNDAPALKKADIGISMGITGTDVAKEAADVILADDNFASIIYAVEEGRAVYSNIQRFLVYIFTSNMAEAVPFILFLFSHGAIPLPLTVMQVLTIDLGTDMLPAIGLGAELPEPNTMKRPPRPRNQPLLSMGLLSKALLYYGLLEALVSISAYFFLNWLNGWPQVALASEGSIYRMATTMALAGVVMAQVANVLNCRSNTASIFQLGLFTNKIVLWGVLLEFGLLMALVYAPFLHPVFNTAPLGLKEWAFLLLCIPFVLFIDEFRKLVKRRIKLLD